MSWSTRRNSPSTQTGQDQVVADFGEIQNLYQAATRIQGGRIVSPSAFHNPPLIIRPGYVGGRLDRLEFVTQDDGAPQLGIVQAPVTLYDRSAELPTEWRRHDWSVDQSALDVLPNAESVLSSFGYGTVVEFADPMGAKKPTVRILWGDGNGTWPPSIDTLHLVGTLAREGFYASRGEHKTILDIGCGTGVHGIILAKWSRVKQLDLLDSELGARLTATTNALGNFRTVDKPRPVPFMVGTEALRTEECLVRFISRDASRWLRSVERPYDLAICTPPYVPFLDVLKDESMWRAVAGTDLLRLVLREWQSFTSTLVIQFSEIAMQEVSDLLPSAAPTAVERVGFRIPPLRRFFEPTSEHLRRRGEQWLSAVGNELLDTEALPESSSQHHGFRYMHRIRTYVLRA